MDRHLHDVMMAQYATPEASGNGLVSWDKGVKCVLPSLTLYGAAVQDGTPTPEAPVMPVCNDGIITGTGKNLFNPETSFLCSLNNGNVKFRPKFVDGVYYSAAWYGVIGASHPCVKVQDGAKVKITSEVVSGSFVWEIACGSSVVDGVLQNFELLPQTRDPTWEGVIPSGKPYVMIGVDCVGGRYACGLKNIQVEVGDTYTPYTPYFDGGQATAPELRAIPGTDIRDEWNAQTGKLTRYIWDEIVLNGSESWTLYTSGKWKGFNCDILKEFMSRNACISNYFGAQKQGDSGSYDGNFIWCGVQSRIVYVIKPRNFFDESLSDHGLANWKAHLAEYPLRIWVARNKPLVTYTAPQKLTMPNGYGQIVQVSGSVPDCPIRATYLTHAGGATT